MAEVLNISSMISMAASKAYNEGVEQGKINEKIPLCFREIAFKDNLEMIVKSYRESGCIRSISVNKQGNVENFKEKQTLKCLRS